MRPDGLSHRPQRVSLLAVATVLIASMPGEGEKRDACRAPGTDVGRIAAFVRAGCFEGWSHQPKHLSGATFEGVDYTVHGEIEVFFSPGVERWLEGESAGIPDGEMVVAVERPVGHGAHAKKAGKAKRFLVKVRAQGSTVDGWFWATVPGGVPGPRGDASGRFGDSTCLSCHASAIAGMSTFLAEGGPVDTAGWRPDPELIFPDPPPVERKLPKPLPRPDPAFVKAYGLPADLPAPRPFPPPESDRVPARGINQFLTSDQCRGCHNAGQRLSNSRPNMWYPAPEGDDPTFRNFSPYGEWSASIHALATRDPIWHAEVESEVEKNPQLADYIYDTCFSCHGPMAGRQLKTDTGDPSARFTDAMFWADRPGEPGATYGALARDGISCAACHRATDALLGVDLPPTSPRDHILSNAADPWNDLLGFGVFIRPQPFGSYTGNFQVDTAGALFGPYPSPLSTPMRNAIGFHPVGPGPAAGQNEQITEAKLCGSCHTIIVPSVPAGYPGADPSSDPNVPVVYEQTTYWEWRNSFWENETGAGLPCQGCHMAPHRGRDGRLLARRIANIESARFPPVAARLSDPEIDLPERFPYPRHVFLGINLFVLEMFQQFPDLLGSRRPDPTVPERTLDPLLNASDWETEHAARDSVLTNVLRLEPVPGEGGAGGHLEIDVQVSNYAGHKFPTGAGIRRAFIELTVLGEDGAVLWSSGTTDELGLIVDGATGEPLPSELTKVPAESQPHYRMIDRQDQVQIYESRTVDAEGRLQSSVLGIASEYKDNRILPAGWLTEAPADEGTFQVDRRFPNPSSINLFAIHPRLPVEPPQEAPALGVLGSDIPDYCDQPELGLGYDPYYCDPNFTQYGADVVTYRVPLENVPRWACVQARILYQATPPYYLRDLLTRQAGEPPLGPAAERLAYIASRLNFERSAIDAWSLQVGDLASRLRDGKTQRDPVLRSCRGGRGGPDPTGNPYRRSAAR